MKCEVILPKNEMMVEYCFYRTLSIHLQSDQLASRRTVGCTVYPKGTLLACNIHPSLIQLCFHSLGDNLLFYPIKQPMLGTYSVQATMVSC